MKIIRIKIGKIVRVPVATDPGTGGAVASVNGQTGVVVLDKTSIGLPNVNNTSDANKPVSAATQTALDLKADAAVTQTALNLKADAAATQTALNLKVNTTALAAVATSGIYADLTGKPTIPAAPVNSDWNASSGLAQILNKPTIPAAQVSSDWTATSGVSQILNKPTYTVLSALPGSLAGYVDGSEIVVTG